VRAGPRAACCSKRSMRAAAHLAAARALFLRFPAQARCSVKRAAAHACVRPDFQRVLAWLVAGVHADAVPRRAHQARRRAPSATSRPDGACTRQRRRSFASAVAGSSAVLLARRSAGGTARQHRLKTGQVRAWGVK